MQVDGNRLRLAGAVTFATVAPLVEEGYAHIRTGVSLIDFQATTQVDSSAIALALAWLRAARESQIEVAFANLPPAMLNLARLYAVTDLIPIARA
jgi:phospholipid transport system transporter-binding protein